MSRFLQLGLFFLTTIGLLVLPLRAARACNPYQSTLKITVGPENPQPVNLFYSLRSSCKHQERSNTKPACGGFVTLPPFTAFGTKCDMIANAIRTNTACFGVTVDSTTCTGATPSLTVTDTVCSAEGTADDGLVFGIANDERLLTANPSSGIASADYEFDTIIPGCDLQGNADSSFLKGTATGVAISGATSGVTASTITISAAVVTANHPTTVNEKATDILSALAAALNSQAPGIVKCEAKGTVLQCKEFSGQGRTLRTSLQNNDQGLTRGSVAGTPGFTNALLVNTGTNLAPAFSQVGRATLVPILGTKSRMSLATLLAALGALCVARRRSSRPSAS